MRIRVVHLAFVEFFVNRLPMTTIETLWNHQVMPLLQKPTRIAYKPPRKVIPVVEPTEVSANDRATAKPKPDVVSQIIDPAANALECGS